MDDDTDSSRTSNNVDIPSLILLAGLELRGNLSKVIFYSEMLLKEEFGTLDEKQKTVVQNIQKSGQWLARFEDMLTALARIETGDSIPVEGASLLECFHESTKSLNQAIEEKGQEITVELTDQLPLVSANAFYLGEVLFFLLSNAHQYTPKDGQIRITTEILDEKVKVTISDTGVGVPLADQKKVFDLLYRVNHPVVMEHDGLGAGLYFAKYYIEYFGGNVGIESAPDEGSKFWFTIPIAAIKN